MTNEQRFPNLTRRGFLYGATALGSTALLTGCMGGGGGGGGAGGGGIVLQSSLSDPAPKAALEALVKSYSSGSVTLNTVAIEQFRAQLSTYLTSGNPPDVLTWYAGSVARDYAAQDLLLDLSDLWTGDGAAAGYSAALKDLSTDASGRQIFLPTNYYWWGVFYRKSAFEEWGVEVPTTWDEFMALCETLQGQGIVPLSNGIGSTPWMASGWFDILNLRVNGADYHKELLAGKSSFDSTEVKNVMKYYADIVPFMDPNAPSYAWQDAVTPLVQKKNAMYLVGAFISQNMPEGEGDDLDFFSVPVIDASIPTAEEAPTDGYFASAKTKDADATKAFLSYLAGAESQSAYISASQSSNLPTSPDVDTSVFSPLVQKGVALLAGTEQITQFFNRDSSDDLQTTADAALTKFIAQPGEVDSILKEWQTAADKVFNP
ncbi:ABC transporter substrate-binding protein [Rathayibacter festucae]|uniref:ABC transporter substrate-binding protein n=1 Tax=Rathayibacter festucae DSM 15932 TaxID=1328866 RepID=A0A3Q9UP23_9MICO|nr:ABC transporter substrate-binding protein [Rathayibacter festucae]AZZ50886.1 ABC transporter substrate-binding protein [Rathayibacter festucae DSM 15932]MCJ1699339.1 ABC transporter substrate-binding protein [Rathayibacter festucae]